MISLSDLWQFFLLGAGAIITLSGAGAVIANIIHKAKAPNKKQDERIESMAKSAFVIFHAHKCRIVKALGVTDKRVDAFRHGSDSFIGIAVHGAVQKPDHAVDAEAFAAGSLDIRCSVGVKEETVPVIQNEGLILVIYSGDSTYREVVCLDKPVPLLPFFIAGYS